MLISICNCSKNSSNSDGVPLVPDSGGQVGFGNETSVPITPSSSLGQPGGGAPAKTFSEINVPISGTIVDKNKFIVEIYVEHSLQSNISISLIAPSGAEYLFIRNAGTTGKYVRTNKLRFSAAFTNSLPNTGIGFPAGDYKESDSPTPSPIPLAPIFSNIQGTSIQGIWKLKIVDKSTVSSGNLVSWKVIF